MPSVGVLLGGVAVIASLVAWGLWERSDAVQNKAAAAVAVAANKSNQVTIDRLESDQIIAQAVAIADANERRKLESETNELRQAVTDASCPGLDALIERRRLQRSPGGSPNP